MKLQALLPFMFFFALAVGCNEPSPESEANRYEAVLKGFYKEDQPGASIVVAWEGEVLFEKAYGLANLEWEVLATPETVYQIDSITKVLTATAILRLEEEGKITLGDPLSKFYPSLVPNDEAITIRHLLTHTSGVINQAKLGEKWIPHVREDFSLDEVLSMIAGEPADFAPGERTEYNNNNYVLLGAVIEQVSRKPYATYMEDEVFRPLGLNHTFYGNHERIIPNRAEGYVPDGDRWKKAPFMSMTHPYAAGALLSSAGDLSAWAQAVSDGGFLSVDTFRKSLEPSKTNSDEDGAYGLGWFISDLQQTKAYSHGGSSSGFSSEIILIPEFSVFVAVLSNNSTGQPGPNYISRRLAALAIGRPFEMQEEITLPTDTLHSFSGVYSFSSGQEVTIEVRDDRLVFITEGASPAILFAESDNTFFMTVVEAKIRFDLGEDRTVKGFVFIQGGRELPAIRERPANNQ